MPLCLRARSSKPSCITVRGVLGASLLLLISRLLAADRESLTLFLALGRRYSVLLMHSKGVVPASWEPASLASAMAHCKELSIVLRRGRFVGLAVLRR